MLIPNMLHGLNISLKYHNKCYFQIHSSAMDIYGRKTIWKERF